MTISVLYFHKRPYEEDKTFIENQNIVLNGDEEYPVKGFSVVHRDQDTILFADMMNSRHIDVCAAYDDTVLDLHFLLLEDFKEYQHFGEAIEELINPENYYYMTLLTLEVNN